MLRPGWIYAWRIPSGLMLLRQQTEAAPGQGWTTSQVSPWDQK